MKKPNFLKPVLNYINNANPAVVIIFIIFISLSLVFGTIFFASNQAGNNSNQTDVGDTLEPSDSDNFAFASSSSIAQIDSVDYEGTLFDNRNTIFENFIKNESFSQISGLITDANLEPSLNSNDKLTIFLPENEAFSSADPQVLTSLLNPENKEKLEKTIKYHIVQGEIYKKDLQGGARLLTLEGNFIQIGVQGDIYTINESEIKTFDLPSRNGVIHVVKDLILLPGELVNSQ
jgi:uncharacterized surface protein with fasciclin (FAS1) repeats